MLRPRIHNIAGQIRAALAAGLSAVFGAVTGTSFNGVQLLTGTAIPSAGAGVAATRPAIYVRTGTDQVYIKTGAGDTGWTLNDTRRARIEFFTNPAGASTTVVHAAVLPSAANAFPGPITNPVIPRNVFCAFGAAWDGGDLTIVGTDQFDAAVTEVIADNPGASVQGVKIFKTITSITKQSIGVGAVGASVGVGTKVGLNYHPTGTGSIGFGTVNNVNEPITFDSVYPAWNPGATGQNGSNDYVICYPSFD